ncbi:hypothetical protein [Polyangium jinanense]|uniref:DUF4349 domain-containing protein n=1 Tax=Polyangium jinanense TaxID=2829994 RepID=A0A9X4AQR9_9BACT|nr:hypothetical protein [Polyangium jinanense]MDC3953028.1 hypothetical protein [Polyangium jinanense]MDC3980646.1 hypothetical protein [Polyangium jinanense]
MSPSGRKTLLVLVTLLVAPAIAGCGMASTIETNTRAIQETTKTMNDTAGVLERSNSNMERMAGELDALGTPMERLSGLEAPMKDLAALGPVMDRLGAGMARLEAQMGTMEKGLARLEKPMEDVALLREPMKEVAALDAVMGKVARLDEPMSNVAALRGPMEDVATLRGSMETMANFARGDAGMKTAGYAFGALAAWAGATFLGVYLGFLAGMRRLRTPRRSGRKPRARRSPVVVPISRGGAKALGGKPARGRKETREEEDEHGPASGVRQTFSSLHEQWGSHGPTGAP